MRLGIELYSDSSLYCYERGIISASLWLKRNFEMMFMDAWDFSVFTDLESEKNNIGILVNPGEWNIEYYLKKYHGIEVNKKKYQSDYSSFLEEVNFEIDKGRPVLIGEDFLVVGTDIKNKIISAYRIRNNLFVEMPFWELKEEDHEYVTFEMVSDDVSDMDSKYLLQYTQERISKVTNSKFIFNQIQEFAEIFYVAFDISEIKNALDIYETPIVKNILDVSRGRKLFVTTLKYVDGLCRTNIFDSLCTSLNDAENRWLFIMSLFIKAYYTSSLSESERLKIYRCIKDAAAYEKSIFKLLGIV